MSVVRARDAIAIELQTKKDSNQQLILENTKLTHQLETAKEKIIMKEAEVSRLSEAANRQAELTEENRRLAERVNRLLEEQIELMNV